jgi:hypothetical protein
MKREGEGKEEVGGNREQERREREKHERAQIDAIPL